MPSDQNQTLEDAEEELNRQLAAIKIRVKKIAEEHEHLKKNVAKNRLSQDKLAETYDTFFNKKPDLANTNSSSPTSGL